MPDNENLPVKRAPWNKASSSEPDLHCVQHVWSIRTRLLLGGEYATLLCLISP